MKFENTRAMNFEGAFRGLRNPLESWKKSDSFFGIGDQYTEADYEVSTYYAERDGLDYEKQYDDWYFATEKYDQWLNKNGVLKLSDNYILEYAYIGPKDLDLAQRMIKAGTSDSKFLRQIFVSVDITAPLYWWKQFDTYKIGTTANSTSTMHKLASTPITFDCFETDDFNENLEIYSMQESKTDSNPAVTMKEIMAQIISHCETLRLKYNKTKDKRYWKELIRLLPEGWLQTRTVTMNYAVLRNIYFQRRTHKLSEWHQFCDWIKQLPYGEELIMYKP